MNTKNFSAIVKTDAQLQDLIKTIDPFQKGDVYEIERDIQVQLEWITNGEVQNEYRYLLRTIS